MSTQVGLFEAKTKLSEIVRRVEQGERFTITLRGKAVAHLGPVPAETERKRAAAEAVRQLLNTPRIPGVSAEMIREFIDEGRKY